MRKLIFCSAVAFLCACSSDVSGDREGVIGQKDSLVRPDSASLFVLPTPLQVATFLHTHAQKAHPEFLSDKSRRVSDYSTDYQRGMNLGICIADAGYAALYNNRQLALDYIARAEDLVKVLRIEPAAAPYMFRIRNNISNHDSLSFLLLSMYSDVQQHLNEGKREKTAFYIVSGCYLENLAITLQHEQLQTNASFIQLVAQEKIWLDNLTEALTYLEPDTATQDLYSTFYTLQEFSKDFAVSIDKHNRPTCTFTTEAYETLLHKSLQLRDEATGLNTDPA